LLHLTLFKVEEVARQQFEALFFFNIKLKKKKHY
jgi:hypothetical protein